MAWDGIWRLTEPPMSGKQVEQIQDRALRHFASYAVAHGVKVNGLYDQATYNFIAEYQERKEASGYKPVLPANVNAQRGECDYATKQALGILPMAPAPPGPAAPKYVGYAFPGTWGTWNVGPHCMAVNRTKNVWLQGVQWNTAAFLNPDPMHSYIEARNEGTAEGLRLALPDPRPKFLAGYSMGGDVVTRFLHAWPADRRHEIVGVFKFGDPGNAPGHNKVGAVSAVGGISKVYTPEWALDRTWSYLVSGDMYGDAPGLLPPLYELLTRMEISLDFALYLFGWLTGMPLTGGGSAGLGGLLGGGLGGLLGGGAGGGALGGLLGNLGSGLAPMGNQTALPSAIGAGLLGLAGGAVGGPIGGITAATAGFGALKGILGMVTAGPVNQTDGPISLPQMLLNLPQIVPTLLAAMKFVFTNAHGKYWGAENSIFDGLCAEDHASQTVTRLAV